MTCIICGKTDEPEEIETGFTDPVKRAAAEAKSRAQAEAFSHWEHVQVTITRAGGRLELLAGSVCPEEQLEPGSLALIRRVG